MTWLIYMLCLLPAAAAHSPSVKIQNKTFFVEVAKSRAEWTQGLMNREHLAPNMGMLFLGKQSREQTFWMKNTLIPLDMIFISDKGRIVHIEKNAAPLTETPRPSIYPARDVLEINGGLSDTFHFKEGVKDGDLVHYQNISSENK